MTNIYILKDLSEPELNVFFAFVYLILFSGSCVFDDLIFFTITELV